MKVLLVWNGPANSDEHSVLARREVALVRQLRDDGVDVSVALFGDAGGLAADFRSLQIPVTVIPVSLPPSAVSIIRIPAASLRLRALIARTTHDLIEATEPMPTIAAALASRGRMLIYRRQHETGRPRLLWASRVAARLAFRTLVSCEAMRQRAGADDRTPPDRIVIATPGTPDAPPIPESERASARHSLGIDDRAHVIAAVSRLRYEKGLDTLIRALDELRDAGYIHLVIAGSGPEESRLRALAARSSVPVHFLGHCSDVARWLQVADVVAIPSRREAFGRVVLEAMVNGRAVVATRAGGLSEAVVDGETGLLVPVDDAHALAVALSRVLTDDSFARKLGAAARERFQSRYTIPHMAAARRAAWERSLAAAGEA